MFLTNDFSSKSLIMGGVLGLGILTISFFNNNEEKKQIINKQVNKEVKKEVIQEYGNFIEIDNDDEIKSKDKNVSMVIYSKKKGYKMLINSMYNYINNNKNIDFKTFLKKEWEDDYNVMINSSPGSSVNRDYKNWEKIFNNIKNKIK
jgi:hypothetical protein